MAKSYNLSTTHCSTGEHTFIEYSPRSYRSRHTEYVCNFKQFMNRVKDEFTAPGNYHLYSVSSDGKVQNIISDVTLQNLVRKLPEGGVLSVTAVPAKTKHTRFGKTVHSDSDSDSEDAEHVARELQEHFFLKDTNCYVCQEADLSIDDAYQYIDLADYICCGKCIREHYDPDYWVSCEEVWGSQVPAIEIEVDDESRAVRHLQYVLTTLGYMKKKDTKKMVGYYGDKTAAAVLRFRKENHITGAKKYDYTTKVAEKLGTQMRLHCRKHYNAL